MTTEISFVLRAKQACMLQIIFAHVIKCFILNISEYFLFPSLLRSFIVGFGGKSQSDLPGGIKYS